MVNLARKIVWFSLVTFFFLSLPVLAQEESPKTIEETYRSVFEIDSQGNAHHRVVVSFKPSSYSDYLKSVPKVLTSQTTAALKSDYALYGWEVKNVKVKVRGRGKGEALEIEARCQIPAIVQKQEGGWLLKVAYQNPPESAQKLIEKWQVFQGILANFKVEKYIESGENVILLPQGAKIIKTEGLEEDSSVKKINYGGGSFSESQMSLEEREGRQAVVSRSTHTIGSGQIAITPTELAEEISEAAVVQYRGELKDSFRWPENSLAYLLIGAGVILGGAVVIAYLKAKG